MFTINYIPPSPELPVGQIRAEIHREVSFLYPEDEFEFVVYSTPLGFIELDRVKFRVDLKPGMWGSWDPLEKNLRAVIRNKRGFIYGEFKMNHKTNGDPAEQFFSHWVDKNNGAKGIAIGTHDGTSGEWVNPVVSGKVDALLVEGSEKAFLRLQKNYSRFNNVICLNEVIFSESGEVEFYEFDSGEANTLSRSHMESHLNESELVTTVKSSISINDLILREGMEKDLKWLHLDLENLDDVVIKSLDFSRIRKPEVIIFESINFSPERLGGDTTRIDSLRDWLGSKGYSVVYGFWNSFAYLYQ